MGKGPSREAHVGGTSREPLHREFVRTNASLCVRQRCRQATSLCSFGRERVKRVTSLFQFLHRSCEPDKVKESTGGCLRHTRSARSSAVDEACASRAALTIRSSARASSDDVLYDDIGLLYATCRTIDKRSVCNDCEYHAIARSHSWTHAGQGALATAGRPQDGQSIDPRLSLALTILETRSRFISSICFNPLVPCLDAYSHRWKAY